MRVYFRLESLHVEIFSARDVIPLDPNGDAEHDFLLTIIDIRVTLKLKEQSLCCWKWSNCWRSQRSFCHDRASSKADLQQLRSYVCVQCWEAGWGLFIFSGQRGWGWAHSTLTLKRLLNCESFYHFLDWLLPIWAEHHFDPCIILYFAEMNTLHNFKETNKKLWIAFAIQYALHSNLGNLKEISVFRESLR